MGEGKDQKEGKGMGISEGRNTILESSQGINTCFVLEQLLLKESTRKEKKD